MIQEVGVNMAAKCVLWVKARPDYEPLFSILDGLHLDSERRYWIEHKEAEGDFDDIEVDTGQVSVGVEIQSQVSHNLIFGQEFGHFFYPRCHCEPQAFFLRRGNLKF